MNIIFNTTTVSDAVIGHRNTQAWQTHRICIVGSRGMSDRRQMHRVLSSHSSHGFWASASCTFICGRANGADRLGELWATKYMPDSPRRLYEPDWSSLGRKAGFCRNVHMASEANEVIAFWDQTSRGTRHMLDTCHAINKHNLNKHPLRIHVYDLRGQHINPERWWKPRESEAWVSDETDRGQEYLQEGGEA